MTEIYCKKCTNFEECKYVLKIKKHHKHPADLNPVLWGTCVDYIPNKSMESDTND